MKRLLLILLTIAVCTQIQAIPAQRNLVKVKQPDGTELSIRLVGDEYLHFNVTEDGYSVVLDERGFYVYAQLDEHGQLVPTQQVAHDVELRQDSEKAFLTRIETYLTPEMPEEIATEKKNESARRMKSLEKRRAAKFDYSKFRGLVILVEFNDKQFDHKNYTNIITDMITKENYDGYYDHNNVKVSCTGSVKDYYRDNSMGLFQPNFDIVGPVQINYSQFDPKSTSNSSAITCAALNAVDATVNFRNYDTDNDGTVDMVYFIFAGHGAHVSGNDSNLVWPHASTIRERRSDGYYYYVNKDGVRLGRYACSTEFQGGQKGRTIDGIGTICHEFSHVLGLPDFYDTDYAKGGGQSKHPANWSLMAGGGYLNDSRTPAGLSYFERCMIGFAEPVTIKETGNYSLEPLQESNKGYRINSPVNKEYFILENRQKTRWDAYLPGHGLLVFRVDSTSTSVWSNNTVNANPSHNYYELVRARGTGAAAASDPFPGNGRVTTLNNTTSPANLKTWSGKDTQFGLINITETNNIISFGVEDTYHLRELSLPETLTIGLGITGKITPTVEPDYATFKLTWKSADESIATVDQEGNVLGVGEGQTTITAESNNGLSASCVVTVIKLPETDNIETFISFDEDVESILSLNNAQVLYVHQKDIYMRDETGALILNNSGLNVKQNDIISGKFTGTLKHRNEMPLLVLTQDVYNLNVSEGNEAQPHQLKANQLSKRYYADLVLVESVELVRSGGVFALDDDKNQVARLYNPFSIRNLSIPPDPLADKRFDVLAIYGTNSTGAGINELYLLKSPEEAEWTPSGIELNESATQSEPSVYDLQGRKILSSQLPKGIYIIDGRKVVVK